MRLYGIEPTDVETAVGNSFRIESDDKGNPRLAGPDSHGRAIIVVIAGDDPGFVITAFPND